MHSSQTSTDWSNIVKMMSEFLYNNKRDRYKTESDYFKLLLLKIILQTTETHGALVFFFLHGGRVL